MTLIWEGHREKFGRLLGRVIMPDGQDMAKAIVKAGYAVNYDGGLRLGWYPIWAVSRSLCVHIDSGRFNGASCDSYSFFV